MSNPTTELQITNLALEDNEDFRVEYELSPVFDQQVCDVRKQMILDQINSIDNRNAAINSSIRDLDSKIDILTNHADLEDYTASLLCGLVGGAIDSFFVGNWDFEKAKAISNKQVNEKIMNFAKKKGYDGNRLDGAIGFLEKKYKLPGDNEFHEVVDSFGKETITLKTHHLDDFCHHRSLIGLLSCIIVQFSGNAIYSDKTGTLSRIPVTVNDYGSFVGSNTVSKFFSGVINWFLNVAKTIANRKGHLMSDMAGSKSSAGSGTGIPGSFLSLMKELAALPCFKKTDFNEQLRKAYQNGIGTEKKQVDLGAFNKLFEGASSKLDLRTEGAITHELKRQSVPVLIYEALVRGFYFVRHLYLELKEVEMLSLVNWRNVIPLNNRTIARMMTIASGTFLTADLADAAISAVKDGSCDPSAFFSTMLLRVNFVGIGRVSCSILTDSVMGVKREIARNKRINLLNEQLHLTNAKVFYKQADKWISAVDTFETIESLYEESRNSILHIMKMFSDLEDSFSNIGVALNEIEHNNPGIKKELLESLQWG